MVQVRKKTPAARKAPAPRTPKHAAACCRPVDGFLDPAWFKALCDPTRLRLLGCVVKCGRACSVTEVAECCDVDLSVVSRHLQVLARAQLVTASKSGRTVSYRVNYTEICSKLRGLADAIDECCPAEGACCAAGTCCTR